MGSYLSLALLKGDFLDDVPSNLLYLMGISVGSSITASGIRAVQEPIPPVEKSMDAKKKQLPAEGRSIIAMFYSEGYPYNLSIAKLQMIAWTIVSIADYGVAVE